MRQTFSVTFKTLVIALGLSLVNPAFAAEPAKAAPAGPEKADVAKGEALYNAGDAKRGLAACMGCHGPNGVSGGGTYPKLAGQHAAYTVKQLKDYKAGKDRPNAIMAAFAGMMTEQDMINVAAYLEKQTPGLCTAKNKTSIELGQRYTAVALLLSKCQHVQLVMHLMVQEFHHSIRAYQVSGLNIRKLSWLRTDKVSARTVSR